MTHANKSGQRGFSMFGFLFVAIVLAVVGLVAAQVVPTAMEFQAVKKAARKAAEGSSVAEARSIFDKAVSIDNIKSIAGKDIEVTKVNDKTIVSFEYQSEIHLAGPAYLTLKYAGSSR
ncbi:MAG: DUF4845 domain-containing protein [Rhodoferax sp.]|nr:DUF4845 domain-containing protein [Rhodoferax sp.]